MFALKIWTRYLKIKESRLTFYISLNEQSNYISVDVNFLLMYMQQNFNVLFKIFCQKVDEYHVRV